jgi:hypothetical protein
LVHEHISAGYAELVLCETQRQLAQAEQTNTLPKGIALANMTVDEIIRKCKPAGPCIIVDRRLIEELWMGGSLTRTSECSVEL